MNAIVRPTDTPSPFIKGTKVQYAVDSTSLGYLKTCAQLYKYVIIDGWVPKDESIHLYFGDEYHKSQQEYEIFKAQGQDHETALRNVVRNLLTRTHGWDTDPDTRAGKYKNRNSLVRTVIWRLDKFKDDNLETYILADGSPAVELSFRFELDWGPIPGRPYILCGHLDRVVSIGGNLFVMDYKTTTSTPGPYYFNQFEPNNQMSLYTLASKIVLEATVKGVMIEAAQLLVHTSHFERGFTFRTEEQLAEWLTDLKYHLAIAKGYAESGYWPKNDTACDKYGGCQFRGICSKSPSQREIYLKSNFTKLEEGERWNPLKPR